MNKGDRVGFQGRVGTVENVMPNGMIDIRFDDSAHRVERRDHTRLQPIARTNSGRPQRMARAPRRFSSKSANRSLQAKKNPEIPYLKSEQEIPTTSMEKLTFLNGGGRPFQSTSKTVYADSLPALIESDRAFNLDVQGELIYFPATQFVDNAGVLDKNITTLLTNALKPYAQRWLFRSKEDVGGNASLYLVANYSILASALSRVDWALYSFYEKYQNQQPANTVLSATEIDRMKSAVRARFYIDQQPNDIYVDDKRLPTPVGAGDEIRESLINRDQRLGRLGFDLFPSNLNENQLAAFVQTKIDASPADRVGQFPLNPATFVQNLQRFMNVVVAKNFAWPSTVFCPQSELSRTRDSFLTLATLLKDAMERLPLDLSALNRVTTKGDIAASELSGRDRIVIQRARQASIVANLITDLTGRVEEGYSQYGLGIAVSKQARQNTRSAAWVASKSALDNYERQIDLALDSANKIQVWLDGQSEFDVVSPAIRGVVCRANLASFDLASRLVREQPVYANETQLTPDSAREVLEFVKKVTIYKRQKAERVKAFNEMTKEDKKRLFDAYASDVKSALRRDEERATRTVQDYIVREENRIKQITQKRPEDIESDIQKIIQRDRGAFFTRADPPRLSNDNRVYCGNPIDGVVYYLAVDKTKRWDAPFVKFDQIYEIAGKMFKGNLASVQTLQAWPRQGVSRAPRPSPVSDIDVQRAQYLNQRQAEEVRITNDLNAANQAYADARNAVLVAELDRDCKVTMAKFFSTNEMEQEAAQRAMPQLLSRVYYVLSDKFSDITGKAIALNFLAEIGPAAAVEAVLPIAQPRHQPTEAAEIALRQTAQTALYQIMIRAPLAKATRLWPYMPPGVRNHVEALAKAQDTDRLNEEIALFTQSLNAAFQPKMDAAVRMFVRNARIREANKILESRLTPYRVETTEKGDVYYEVTGGLSQGLRQKQIDPSVIDNIRVSVEEEVNSRPDDQFLPTPIERQRIADKIYATLAQPGGGQIPDSLAAPAPEKLSPNEARQAAQRLSEQKSELREAEIAFGLAMLNEAMVERGLPHNDAKGVAAQLAEAMARLDIEQLISTLVAIFGETPNAIVIRSGQALPVGMSPNQYKDQQFVLTFLPRAVATGRLLAESIAEALVPQPTKPNDVEVSRAIKARERAERRYDFAGQQYQTAQTARSFYTTVQAMEESQPRVDDAKRRLTFHSQKLQEATDKQFAFLQADQQKRSDVFKAKLNDLKIRYPDKSPAELRKMASAAVEKEILSGETAYQIIPRMGDIVDAVIDDACANSPSIGRSSGMAVKSGADEDEPEEGEDVSIVRASDYRDLMFNRTMIKWEKFVGNIELGQMRYADPVEVKAVDSITLTPGPHDRVTLTFPSVQLLVQMAKAFESYAQRIEHRRGVRLIPIDPRPRSYQRIRAPKHYFNRVKSARPEELGKQPRAEPAGREADKYDSFGILSNSGKGVTYFVESGWSSPGYKFLNSFEFFDYQNFIVARGCTLLEALVENLGCSESIARSLIASGAVSTPPFEEKTLIVAMKGYPLVNTEPETRLLGPQPMPDKPEKFFPGSRVSVWLRDKADSPFFSWVYTNIPVATGSAFEPCLSADELALRERIGFLRRAMMQLNNGFRRVHTLMFNLAENPAGLRVEREDPNKPKRRLADGTFGEVSRLQFASDTRRAVTEMANGYLQLRRWFNNYKQAEQTGKAWAIRAKDILQRAEDSSIPTSRVTFTVNFSGNEDAQTKNANMLRVLANLNLSPVSDFVPPNEIKFSVDIRRSLLDNHLSVIREALAKMGSYGAPRVEHLPQGAGFQQRDLSQRWIRFVSDSLVPCSTCSGTGLNADRTTCTSCLGSGKRREFDFGLLSPDATALDINENEKFQKFLREYDRKILSELPRTWNPEDWNSSEFTTSRSILAWLRGLEGHTPVDSMLSYAWNSLTDDQKQMLTINRNSLLRSKGFNTFRTAKPVPMAEGQINRMAQLLTGQFTAKIEEQQRELDKVGRFIEAAGDLAAGGVRMSARPEPSSPDPWRRIGVKFGDPLSPTDASADEIASWHKWLVNNWADLRLPPRMSESERQQFLADLTWQRRDPTSLAATLFDQWKSGESARAKAVGVKARFAEARGEEKPPYEALSFRPPDSLIAELGNPETRRSAQYKINALKDQNWALSFLLNDVFPTLRDAQDQDQALQNLRELVLVLTLYYDLGGYKYSGPIDSGHPDARLAPDQTDDVHVLERMSRFLSKEENDITGGISLAAGSSFNIFKTYNPVLFELTRLFWRSRSGFLYQHPQALGDIDALGRYGEAAVAAQKAAITSSNENEVFERLRAMIQPALTLRPDRANLTRILRGPTKKRGQPREERPEGPSELELQFDSGPPERITVGTDPLGESIGHFESFCLLWPFGADFVTARNVAVQFMEDPVYYLAKLKREEVDPALDRARQLAKTGIARESAISIPKEVEPVLDQVRGLQKKQIDPLHLEIPLDAEALTRVSSGRWVTGDLPKPTLDGLNQILLDSVNALAQVTQGSAVSSDQFYMTLSSFLRNRKFQMSQGRAAKYLSGAELDATLAALPGIAIALGKLIDDEPKARTYLRQQLVTYMDDPSIPSPALTDAEYAASLRERGLDVPTIDAQLKQRARQERDLLKKLNELGLEQNLVDLHTGSLRSLNTEPLVAELLPAITRLDVQEAKQGRASVNFANYRQLHAIADIGFTPDQQAEKDAKFEKLELWVAAGLPLIDFYMAPSGQISPKVVAVNKDLAEQATAAAIELLRTKELVVGQRKISNPFYDIVTARREEKKLVEIQQSDEKSRFNVLVTVRAMPRAREVSGVYDAQVVARIAPSVDAQVTKPTDRSLPPLFDERKYAKIGSIDEATWRWSGDRAVHTDSALERPTAAVREPLGLNMKALDQMIDLAQQDVENLLTDDSAQKRGKNVTFTAAPSDGNEPNSKRKRTRG